MRRSGIEWTPEMQQDLLTAMEKRTGSVTTVAKKFAKKVGTTHGAVYAKYNILRKTGIPASNAHSPNPVTHPEYAFNTHIKRIEEITGHTFTPSEIVEMDGMVKH